MASIVDLNIFVQIHSLQAGTLIQTCIVEMLITPETKMGKHPVQHYQEFGLYIEANDVAAPPKCKGTHNDPIKAEVKYAERWHDEFGGSMYWVKPKWRRYRFKLIRVFSQYL